MFLLQISPTDGPPEGGTVLTIEGYIFGIHSDVTVTVAGVPCNTVTLMGQRLTLFNLLFIYAQAVDVFKHILFISLPTVYAKIR